MLPWLLAKGEPPPPLTDLEAGLGVGAILAGVFAALVVAGLRAWLRRRAVRGSTASYPNVKA